MSLYSNILEISDKFEFSKMSNLLYAPMGFLSLIVIKIIES